jgi:PAS domain S-box-containing protein
LGISFALFFYLIIQVFYEYEDWLINRTIPFNPVETIIKVARFHGFSLLVGIAICLFAFTVINTQFRKIIESEARTRNVFGSAVEGIIIINEKGIIEDINPAALRIFGYSHVGMIGKNVSILMPEPYHHEHNDYIQNYLRTGSAKVIGFGREVVGRRKDGTLFPMELAVSKFFVDNRIQFTGMLRDITTRKQINNNLATQYQRQSALAEFDLFLNQSLDLQNMLDQAVKVTMNSLPASGGACIILIGEKGGNQYYYSSDFPDKKMGNFSKILQQDQEALKKIITNNQLIIEKDLTNSQSTLKLLLLQNQIRAYAGVPLSVDNEVIGALFALDKGNRDYQNDDIHYLQALANRIAVAVSKFWLYEDLKATNNLLEFQRGQLYAVLDSINEAIVLLSPEGRLLTMNTKFADLIRVNVKEIVNHPLEEYKSLFDRIFEERKSFQVWAYQINSDSEHEFSDVFIQQWPIRRELALFSTPVWTDERIHIGRLFVFQDITKERELDRMKSEFVSSVSHELRTPLTSIHGSLGLIYGGVVGEISAKVKPLVEIAYKNSERLIRLINDILDIEKIETGKISFEYKPVELMPLLEQAIEFNKSYGEQFGVHYNLQSSLPGVKVNVDCDRFIQVITNLLSNAAKFSNPKDQVEILVEQLEKEIKISITDHGIGIPKEFRKRIFQRFEQADSSNIKKKEGTGLGLSICKAIVEKMGGQIDYKSKLNFGTTFYFTLPEWEDKSELEKDEVVSM